MFEVCVRNWCVWCVVEEAVERVEENDRFDCENR